MATNLTGALIDASNNRITRYTISRRNIAGSLAKACKCEYIEILTRVFNNKPYWIICDEEARLKRTLPPTAIYTKNKSGNIVEEVIGNVFICGMDFKSLTEKEIIEFIKLSGGILIFNI